MGRSPIEWCTDTLNPVRGCKDKNKGCLNCYAKRLAATRLVKHPKYKGLATYHPGNRTTRQRGIARWTGEVQLDIDVMREVLTWRKPRQCFLCDMSDLFYERVPFEFIAAVLGYVVLASSHRFYVLTKRADRMREFFGWLAAKGDDPYTTLLEYAARRSPPQPLWTDTVIKRGLDGSMPECEPWPLPNLWLGVSAADQETADEAIPELLSTPAAVKFVSYEPIVGPVDFDPPTCECDERLGRDWSLGSDGATPFCNHCESEMGFGAWLDPLNDGISWVIGGAESGPGRRPASVDWVRSVRDQCAAAGAAFFLKQWTPADGITVSHLDHAGRDVLPLPLLDGVQHAAFPETSHV